MESILKRLLTEKTALDMIYMKNDGLITKRSIIVRQLSRVTFELIVSPADKQRRLL